MDLICLDLMGKGNWCNELRYIPFTSIGFSANLGTISQSVKKLKKTKEQRNCIVFQILLPGSPNINIKWPLDQAMVVRRTEIALQIFLNYSTLINCWSFLILKETK